MNAVSKSTKFKMNGSTVSSASRSSRKEREPPTTIRAHRQQVWLTVGTWLAFAAAAIYAGLTYRMLCAVQAQTRIQREAAINTERAWVGLDVPITLDAVDIAAEASKIDGHYTIKNFGQGPALKVVQVGDFVTWIWRWMSKSGRLTSIAIAL